jgi:hypothetical protein
MRSASLVIEPSYVRVDLGDRQLRFTAARRADRRQLVRVWAAEYPSKMSRIPEFRQFELEPDDNQSLAREISAINRTYWLVIAVFSNDGTQWIRSRPTRRGPLTVPQTEMSFVDAATVGETQPNHPNTILNILYV